MSISLLSNLTATNVQRHLSAGTARLEKAMERITTGKRINRAGEDAAGLTLAELTAARTRSVARARLNAQEALSLVQVAEGGMNEVGNILIRLRELAVQAASDTVGDKERKLLGLEAEQLNKELERISESTKYFGTTLLNGEGKSFTFQVGPDDNEYNRIEYDAAVVNLRPDALDVDSIDLSDKEDAADALQTIDTAINNMGAPRTEIGAIQTRLHSIDQQLQNEEYTLTAAHGRIMNADLAVETTNLIREQIQAKAGVAVLAQANMMPMLALRLIEG